MPRISQFYGIAIYMYYQDHAPSHFHAIYGEHEAVVEIASATIVAVDPVCGTVVWPNGADFAPEALHQLAAVEETTAALA